VGDAGMEKGTFFDIPESICLSALYCTCMVLRRSPSLSVSVCVCVCPCPGCTFLGMDVRERVMQQKKKSVRE
jgi:hypothetical protein